jgi:hypothetical protein
LTEPDEVENVNFDVNDRVLRELADDTSFDKANIVETYFCLLSLVFVCACKLRVKTPGLLSMILRQEIFLNEPIPGGSRLRRSVRMYLSTKPFFSFPPGMQCFVVIEKYS